MRRNEMNIINNEKGVALVLAMIMLVLMSILGALALSTSTTEIAISGNYRNSQDAFYAADSAVEYAATNGAIYTAIGTGTINLNNAPYKDNIDVNNNGRFGGLDTNATNSVTYITCGTLPVGSIDETDAAISGGSSLSNGNYFLITVTTTTDPEPTSTTGSRSSIEAQIARKLPPGGECPS